MKERRGGGIVLVCVYVRQPFPSRKLVNLTKQKGSVIVAHIVPNTSI